MTDHSVSPAQWIERFESLERRVAQAEAQLALYQQVSLYGPAVDSLQSRMAAELWTDEGVYDIGDPQFDAEGRAAIQALFDADYHRQLVASGCAHTMTLPHLKIQGDAALGLGYHRLFTQSEGRYELFRLSVSRWEWRRIDNVWQTTRRVHRLMGEDGEGRKLLEQTLADMQVMEV